MSPTEQAPDYVRCFRSTTPTGAAAGLPLNRIPMVAICDGESRACQTQKLRLYERVVSDKNLYFFA